MKGQGHSQGHSCGFLTLYSTRVWIDSRSRLCFDRWTLTMETVPHFLIRSKESIMFTRQYITWFPVRGCFFFGLNLHSDSDVCNTNYFCCGCVWLKLAQTHYVLVIHVTTDVPHISRAPVLMMRPRAWNMVEHNVMVQRSPWKYYQRCFVVFIYIHVAMCLQSSMTVGLIVSNSLLLFVLWPISAYRVATV